MDKIAYLDFLYYKVGKSTTDFLLQAQEQGRFMSKRREYSNIGFGKDSYWLARVNARTQLMNEVVIDIDRLPKETDKEFNERTLQVCKEVPKESPKYWGIFESNSSVHCHLFFNEMFRWSDKKRKLFRTKLIKKYQGDLQLVSDNVMINCEMCHHWKSNKLKGLLQGNILDKEKPQKEYPLTDHQKECLKRFAQTNPFDENFVPKTWEE